MAKTTVRKCVYVNTNTLKSCRKNNYFSFVAANLTVKNKQINNVIIQSIFLRGLYCKNDILRISMCSAIMSKLLPDRKSSFNKII